MRISDDNITFIIMIVSIGVCIFCGVAYKNKIENHRTEATFSLNDHIATEVPKVSEGDLVFDRGDVKVYRFHDYKDHWVAVSSNGVSIE